MNAAWTVRIERLAIQLAVGVHPNEREPQPLWVSVTLEGLAPASPETLDDCIDYEPLCRWLTQHWPQTPHTALLETRINELLAFAFGLDARVSAARVGLYKERMSRDAISVGVERHATRLEFEAQRRSQRVAADDRTRHAETID
jgi:7,8-dihydroneopterin aldolase/epimerase/oxygenase